MANEKARAVLQFNEYDFRHRKVLEILRQRPRNKTELVVNAILHYISCPEATSDFSGDSLRKLIREVIVEMVADGSLQCVLPGTAPSQAREDDVAEELGGMMDLFRG